MLKTAHDAEEFMRTGARVSPSWPGGDLRGRIRCSRLISRRSRQNPLQTGRAIRFQHNRSRAVIGGRSEECLRRADRGPLTRPGEWQDPRHLGHSYLSLNRRPQPARRPRRQRPCMAFSRSFGRLVNVLTCRNVVSGVRQPGSTCYRTPREPQRRAPLPPVLSFIPSLPT